MNLMIVIPIHFMPEDIPPFLNITDIFPYTCSYNPILHPAIGPFNLSMSLRAERMCDLDVTIIEHLFPLRNSFISNLFVLTPDAVPALYKPKYGMRICVILKWCSIAQ